MTDTARSSEEANPGKITDEDGETSGVPGNGITCKPKLTGAARLELPAPLRPAALGAAIAPAPAPEAISRHEALIDALLVRD